MEVNPKMKSGEKPLPFINRWRILVISAVIAIILASIAAILTLTLHFEKETPVVYEIDDPPTPLTLVTREEWRALPPTGKIPDLITPVSLVIIQHTVQSTCRTMQACASLVRQAQTIHMEIIGEDIAYNFLVGGDGAAYVGRGWEKLGAHTKGYNSKSIGIAFIGDFREEEPPNRQIIALLKLLRDGVKERQLSENYTLVGANQVQFTESPGKKLIAILPQLPHWSDRIDV